MEPRFYELPVSVGNVTLRVAKGHFATRNSHINYFVDVTQPKYSLMGAENVAKYLAGLIQSDVDTILCMDGTSAIGSQLAWQLVEGGYRTLSDRNDMYIIKGEVNTGSIVIRDNARFMVENKRILILTASVTTGANALDGKRSMEYYGGKVVGIAAIYSAKSELDGLPVYSIYDHSNLGDYQAYSPAECPLCRKGIPVDAVVNKYGYSKV